MGNTAMRAGRIAAIAAAAALGAGFLAGGPVPASATPQAAWAQVSTGYDATCATQTNRTLWCWGSNREGQLGIRGHVSQDAPVRVGLRAGWVQVAAGADHACAVRNDQSLWCWGDGFNGDLGTGMTDSFSHPVQVLGGDVYASVAGTGGTECAIRVDGTLWCWGNNQHGQVGDGSTAKVLAPVQVGSAADWTQVSAASLVTCGVQADGSAWCWGDRKGGAIGDGGPGVGDSLTPVQVLGGHVWAGVSAGDVSTSIGSAVCGTRADETLWCWGIDDGGQQGTGATGTDQDSPARIGIRTGWRHVSVASGHACALHGEPTLWCWGTDYQGDLGNGVYAPIEPVVRVGSSPDWLQVSAGDDEDTCAIMRGHTLWCWGSNFDGQLGLGPAGSAFNTPQQVS